MIKISSKPAFGPLEAVAVLSALLLIISVAFTYWSIHQARQRDLERISNFQTIQSAIQQYYQQHQEFPVGDKDVGDWDLGYQGENDQRFIYPLVEEGFLPANFSADPLSEYDPNRGIDYSFYYQVYPDDGRFCPRGQGQFYVLAIRDLESKTGNPADPGQFEGSGFSCKNRNWQDEFDYVVGGFANPR